MKLYELVDENYFDGFVKTDTTYIKNIKSKNYKNVSKLMDEIYENVKTDSESLFKYTVQCLYWISDNKIETIEQAQKDIYDGMDGLVDIYTMDLIVWLSKSIDNVDFVEDTFKDFRDSKDLNFTTLLMYAQGKCIEMIFNAVISCLDEQLNKINKGGKND